MATKDTAMDMNYYTAFEEGNIDKRVVFAWPRGESPHQSEHHFDIRGPWSTRSDAEEALQKESTEPPN